MHHTASLPRRLARPEDLHRRGAARWLIAVPILALLAATALLLTPAPAGADTPSTLTVVGTSDVDDSGLLSNLIQPDFNQTFPQFAFKYVGVGSEAAVAQAESGAGGPSVLIVHTASLENEFVDDGVSYNSQYGYAIFRDDLVLAGPTTDPAAVTVNAGDNIAQAFATSPRQASTAAPRPTPRSSPARRARPPRRSRSTTSGRWSRTRGSRRRACSCAR